MQAWSIAVPDSHLRAAHFRFETTPAELAWKSPDFQSCTTPRKGPADCPLERSTFRGYHAPDRSHRHAPKHHAWALFPHTVADSWVSRVPALPEQCHRRVFSGRYKHRL